MLLGRSKIISTTAVLFVSLTFLILFSNDTYGIAKQSTLSLSVSDSVLTFTILPSPGGSFGKSGDNTITASTDNYSGYTLKIATDESTSMVNSNDDEIESISSNISEFTFSSGSAYNNKWGYKPSQYVTTSGGVDSVVQNTDFLPAPSSAGDTLAKTSTATNGSDTYTFSAGARIDSSIPEGTYTYTYVLMMVGNPVIYNINYDDNTNETVTNMPSPNPQALSVDGGTPAALSYDTLSSAVPTMTTDDMSFGGWCDVATTTNPTTGNYECSGTTYQPGDDYAIDQTVDGSNITLYAIWLEDPFPMVWSQMGKCIFNNGTISGSECQDYVNDDFIDTGIALYSNDNYLLDYEVHFTLDTFNPNSQSESQATMFNDKLSSSVTGSPYGGKSPGVVIRANSNHGIEIKSTYGAPTDYAEIKNVYKTPYATAFNGTDVRLFRIDGHIYTSIDNGPLIELQDYTSFSQQFGLSAWFGAYPENVDCTVNCTAAKRYFTGEMSNMYIRLGDMPSSGIFDITFNGNAGTPGTKSYKIVSGNSLEELPEVTRSGWLFDGWWTAADGGQSISAATVPSATTTYYAHWKLSVTDAQITNTNIQMSVSDTETINITNASDIEPYTLTSSDSNVATVDSSGVITAVGGGTATITLTGTLSGDTRTVSVTVGTMITVNFNSAGGSPASYQESVASGGSFSSLPSPTRTGYALDGWYTGTDGTGTKLTTSTVFNSNTPTQYYAYWVEQVYVCKMATTLHTETCSRTDSQGCRKSNLYRYGAEIEYGIIPNNTTRSPGFAYTCDVDANNVFDETDERFYYLGTNGDNAVLYYYRNIRNVTENYNPAVADLPDSSTWTNSELVAQANNKVARFMNYSEATTVCGGTSGLLNHTCEYLLERSNFASTNEQDGIWMTKINDGSSGGRRIHTAAVSFGNVNPADGGSNNAPRPVIEVPLSLVEEWAPVIKHNITFDPQNEGQSSISTIEVVNGNTIGSDMPSNPSYTNHLFQRWYDTTTDATVDASTIPTGDMTVYAEWKGTVALAQVASNIANVIEGGTTTLQITNAADLETFTCSSSDATIASVDASTCVITGVAQGTATISITGNDSHVTNSNIVTVTVLDPSTRHRVTFDPRNNDSTFYRDIVPGSAIGANMPQDPTYNGFVFVRWYDVANDNSVTSATIPLANMTVYAEWKLDVTNATISNNDLTVQAGEQITVGVSNASQIEPYTFSSANTSIATVDANTGVITGVSAGTTNIIMTGTSSNLTKTLEVDVTPAPVVQHTVTFNANGGSTPSPYQVDDGDMIGTLPTTTRSNYRFFGWYKDDGTFYQEVYPEEVITSDATFYARWIEDTTSYPIVFSEINACTFGGHNVNISGTYCTQPKTRSYVDSSVALYTASNYGLDYEVGFTIVDYDFGSVQQMTLFAAKYENQAAGWPGLTVRRSNSTDYMEFTQTISGTKASNTSNLASAIHRVKITRESGIIRFSIDDGPMTQLQNMNNITEQNFASTAWFGASATDSNTPQRELVGTLTDMYVKLGAPTEYVIEFNPDGGELASGEESKTINVGDEVGQLPTPTPPNANYTFDAWYDESVSPAVAITSSTRPNSDKTYVAHYTYHSSNTPVVFDVSNDATRGYQTLIDDWVQSPVNITTFNEANPINNSTWGNTSELSELEFWEGVRNNFVDNECVIPSSSDAVKPMSALSAWTSGTVDCSKPDVYDTKIKAALTVRLNDAQGAVVSYAKANNGVIHNMIPGQTYYWEKSDDSTVYGYVTATSNKGTRWVDTGTIRNVRDLGGLPVSYTDGNNQTVTGTVAYGRLFRGEKLNNAPATELTNLGITTEYNVGDEYSSDTHLTDYHLNQVIHYDFDYNSGDENNANSNYMKAWNAVTNIMTDITNANTTKNVYFHCRVGADRTGTVAYLLEGLLGVPDEMRYEEYALTNVSGLYDRTRYYKEKSSSNNLKFVYMMGYVKTAQDIYDWYMQNPNADANLIQAFRAAMTIPSNNTPAPGNQQNNEEQNNVPEGNQLMSTSPSRLALTNSGNDNSDSSDDGSSKTKGSSNSTGGFTEPLGVIENSDGNSDDNDILTGAITAGVAIASSGALAYALTREKEGDEEQQQLTVI